MCGIAALIGTPLPPASEADAARDLMAHRGPDARGSWSSEGVWLGSRRLAIMDLDRRAGQPMRHEETGAVVVFNGEIYNHLELRRELEARGHQFRTRCDTEALLLAYVEWGEDCLRRLNGMWGFVIWDPRSGEALISRDRFGVKPLYYATRPGLLAVASEPKVLLALMPELRRPDPIALYDLLARKRAYAGSRSFYDGVRLVPPASFATVSRAARPSFRPYWRQPVPGGPDGPGPVEAIERFTPIFEDAVGIRLRSDVPVGLTLSGGIDSTAVLHAMAGRREVGSRTVAFTSVYEGQDGGERPWAERAATPYGGVELRSVSAAADDWLGMLGRIVWHMDGPGYSPAVFPLWRIMEAARADGIPVLLEGQGADELFGGYSQSLAAAFVEELERAARRGDAAALARSVRGLGAGARAVRARLLAAEIALQLSPALRSRWRRRTTLVSALRSEFSEVGRGEDDGDGVSRIPISGRLDGQLVADFARDTLPAFLQYGDAISMAHSVESRLPFLDYRLVELARALESPAKVHEGETKVVLREYLRRAGQSAIADRRRKVGYRTPANAWLAENDGRLMRDLLMAPQARVREYVVPERLDALIAHHVAGGHAAGDALYALLTTELWLRQLAQPPKSSAAAGAASGG